VTARSRSRAVQLIAAATSAINAQAKAGPFDQHGGEQQAAPETACGQARSRGAYRCPGLDRRSHPVPPALAGIPREGDDNLKRPQQDSGNVPNQAGCRDGMRAPAALSLPGTVRARIPHSQEANAMHRRGEGWTMFAAIVLAVAGIMRIFDATWAFRYHGVLPGNLEAAIFGHSLKTYGWVYLAAAAVLILCAFLVLSGSQVGRWVAIVTGAIGCISAIWRMVFYPIWVTDLRCHRRSRDLRPRRVPRQSRSRIARPGSAMSLPTSGAAAPSKATANGRGITLGRATTSKTARSGSEGGGRRSWTMSARGCIFLTGINIS
jgi:hypothetical protein